MEIFAPVDGSYTLRLPVALGASIHLPLMSNPLRNLARSSLSSFHAQPTRVGDDLKALGQQFVRDGQRREQADDVAIGSADQHDDAGGVRRSRDAAGQSAVGFSGCRIDQLDGDHGTPTAQVADAGIRLLQRSEGVVRILPSCVPARPVRPPRSLGSRRALRHRRAGCPRRFRRGRPRAGHP